MNCILQGWARFGKRIREQPDALTLKRQPGATTQACAWTIQTFLR
jgi:hypothetical protein